MICPDCGIEFDPVPWGQEVCDFCENDEGYLDGEADPDW